MAKTPNQTGFQPRNTPAERRAFFDLQRKVAAADESGPTPQPIDAWPVGSIFIAVVNTNPATLLGGGTWEAFGTGRMLLATDTTAEQTGGASTVALATANLPAHAHTVPSHNHTINHDHAQATTSSAGTHSHGLYYTAFSIATGSGAWLPKRAQDGGSVVEGTNDAGAHTHTLNLPSFTGNSGTAAAVPTANTGSGTPVNIMPPYITTYMWKRTA